MDFPEPNLRKKSIARKKKIDNEPIYGQKKVREIEKLSENKRKPMIKKSFKNNSKYNNRNIV
jgi:hypothetical protein